MAFEMADPIQRAIQLLLAQLGQGAAQERGALVVVQDDKIAAQPHPFTPCAQQLCAKGMEGLNG